MCLTNGVNAQMKRMIVSRMLKTEKSGIKSNSPRRMACLALSSNPTIWEITDNADSRVVRRILTELLDFPIEPSPHVEVFHSRKSTEGSNYHGHHNHSQPNVEPLVFLSFLKDGSECIYHVMWTKEHPLGLRALFRGPLIPPHWQIQDEPSDSNTKKRGSSDTSEATLIG